LIGPYETLEELKEDLKRVRKDFAKDAFWVKLKDKI